MRYIFLVIINLPVIFLGLLNIITQFKLKKATQRRFTKQLVLWILIFIVLVSSFPTYNLLSGRALFDASQLSLFDVAEITVIIYMIYAYNRQRQKLDQVEKNFRDLHQELSIKLSGDFTKKSRS